MPGPGAPVLPETWELVQRGAIPDGTYRNHRYLTDDVIWEDLTPDEQLVLCDAQTSGGLLIAVPEEKRAALREALAVEGVSAAVIGRIVAGRAGQILVNQDLNKE